MEFFKGVFSGVKGVKGVKTNVLREYLINGVFSGVSSGVKGVKELKELRQLSWGFN